MANTARERRATCWVFVVLALGLPSVAFVLSHVLLARLKLPLPEWLDLVLVWTLFLTGMFGVFTTAGAVLVALAASFLAGLPGKVIAAMWAIAAVSVFALIYLAQVPP